MKKKYLAMGTVISASLFGLVLMQSSGDTLLPNTYLGSVDLGGFTIEEAKTNLDSEIENYMNKKISFNVNGKIYELSPDEIGAELYTDDAIRLAKTQIEDPTQFYASTLSLQEESGKTKIPLTVRINLQKLQAKLIEMIEELDDPEKVSLRFINEDLANEEGVGYTTDYETLAKRVEANLSNMEEGNVHISLLPESGNSDLANKHLPSEEPVTYTYSQEEIDKGNERADFLEHQEYKFYVQLADDDLQTKTWKLNIHLKPEWIEKIEKKGKIEVRLNEYKLREYLNNELLPTVESEKSDAYITALPNELQGYAEVDGIAKDGIKIPVDESISAIKTAVARDDFNIKLPVKITEGKAFLATGDTMIELDLLGTGRSNFIGSPDGRDFNVRKALDDHYNNIILAPGEEFAFNSYLGGPVNHANGWKDSLAIFGPTLRPVPGGGICQVSTTMYRAIVQSGLDVTWKSNHSKYVHYYIDYGDGIDAAIYPGSKDLKFKNDTAGFILIQSYAVDDDAFVKIYGTSDGRDITLEGPYRWNQIPEGQLHNGHKFSSNEILWIQKIKRPDGTIEEKQIVSSYSKGVPAGKN